MGYISPISTKYSISFCIIIVYFVSCKNVKLLSTNIKEKSVKIVFKLEYKKLAKHPPSAGFLSPSGETARSTPHSFKNFRRVMRIPNMYLVLKLDNGKVVSIANEQIHRETDRQTDRRTDTPNTVLVYIFLNLVK